MNMTLTEPLSELLVGSDVACAALCPRCARCGWCGSMGCWRGLPVGCRLQGVPMTFHTFSPKFPGASPAGASFGFHSPQPTARRRAAACPSASISKSAACSVPVCATPRFRDLCRQPHTLAMSLPTSLPELLDLVDFDQRSLFSLSHPSNPAKTGFPCRLGAC